MRPFLKSIVPAAIVMVVAGCGLLDRESGQDAAPETGEAASVIDTVEGPSAPAAVVRGDADEDPLGEDGVVGRAGRDSVGDESSLEDANATSTSSEPPGDPRSAQTVQAETDTLSVEARLDRLILGQEALSRRLDSLALTGPAVVGPGPDLGTGQATPAATIEPDTVVQVGRTGERLGEARQQVRNFGLAVIWSVVVLVIVNFLVRALVWILDTLAERNASRRLFYKRLVPIIRIVLWVFAAYFIVHVIFQVDAQGIIAAAAAVGVAVGFAAQDLLKNLFGGFILVFDQPFQTGDKISVGGTYGEVVSIGLRSTRIVTPDDNLVSVPNAQVVDQQVANANAGELNCQVVTDLYLPGWADETRAKKIAYHAAAGSRYVYLKKPIVVLVSDVFKTTFLTRVRVKAYVLDPRLEFLFQSDVTERARAGFREAGLLSSEERQYELVRRESRDADGIEPSGLPASEGDSDDG